MEYSFSNSMFGFADHSSPEDSWIFPNPDTPSLETNPHFPNQSENFPNYDSDHSAHSLRNNSNDGDSPKEDYFQTNSSSSFRDKDDARDPFSLNSRIPIPGLMPISRYHMWLETSFMCRRNERERQRVRNVNDGFSRLRNHLPRSANMRRRQSKVETLQHAIEYIKQLQSVLGDQKDTD